MVCGRAILLAAWIAASVVPCAAARVETPSGVHLALVAEDNVTLSASGMVERVMAQGHYVFIKDLYAKQRELLPVYIRGRADIKAQWFVLVTGVTKTVLGHRILVASRIQLYTDKSGRPIPPPPPGATWPFLTDIPIGVSMMTEGDPPVPPDPNSPPEEEPEPLSPIPGTIAYATTSADDTEVTLEGKIVTANRADFPGALYIEETNRTFGIRVLCAGVSCYPNRGDSVSVTGTMATGDDGEREIHATYLSAEDDDELTPLGLTNRSLGGSDFNDHTLGVNYPTDTGIGLYNKGLLVKSWGNITARDITNKFFYIDDGTGFEDGSGNTGVKVSWAWPTPGKLPFVPPQEGCKVSVVGLSGSENPSGSNLIRVLRPRNGDDLFLHDPEDTCKPILTIDKPATEQLHIHGTNASYTLQGTASDNLDGLRWVRLTKDNWYSYTDITPTSGTTWQYTWTSIPTGSTTFGLRASDIAGNVREIYRTIHVTSVPVVFVSQQGNDGSNGGSWGTAYRHAQYAIDHCGSSEVWAKAGTYTENSTVAAGVALYGGFAGTEDVREEREWRAYHSIWDGGGSGTVVTIQSCVDPNTRIDGFTIRDGEASYRENEDAYQGGGIFCADTSHITIANNTITDNSAAYAGGGIYCARSSPAISNNVISGNLAGITEGGSGGGIQCSGCAFPTLISNNAVFGNTAICGAGICCWASEENATRIVNNTVTSNLLGSGICISYCTALVANCIVTANAGAGVEAPSSNVTLRYNDVYDQSPNYGEGVSAGTGGISEDPLLTTTPDIYHLQPSSPCISAGNDSDAVTTLGDIDGDARIAGAHVDMGADEIPAPLAYQLSLTAVPMVLCVTQTCDLVATISWGRDLVGGQPVKFEILSAPSGANAAISPEEPSTGADGKAEAELTCDTPGWVTVKASFTVCGTPIEATRSVLFCDCDELVDIFFCLDCTGSMGSSSGSHRATESVKAFLDEMSSTYGIQFRVGGIRFNNPDQGQSGPDSLERDGNGNFTARVFTSLTSFENLTGIEAWIDSAYDPWGYDAPELQLDALHYAAQEMNAHATSNNKYIVLITDDTYHNGDGGSAVTLSQVVSELTATGCPVYISLWNFSQTSYQQLIVNGGNFDPVNSSGNDTPGNWKYPLTNLRNRILADL